MRNEGRPHRRRSSSTSSRRCSLLSLALACAGSVLLASTGFATARDLSFEERVAAQAAIDRIYYAHQTGATLPFERAVPRAALEAKVRRYEAQSLALEQLWSTPVTAAMLERETERIVTQTRLPERLREVAAALGNDPFLIQECLVRPALVERMSRGFLASDERFQVEPRRRAEVLRRTLEEGRSSTEYPGTAVTLRVRDAGAEDAKLDTLSPDGREDLSLAFPRSAASSHAWMDGLQAHQKTGTVSSTSGAAQEMQAPASRSLDRAAFTRLRARLTGAAGGVGDVEDEPGWFVVRALVRASEDELTLAEHRVAKLDWEAWWPTVSAELASRSMTAVAAPGAGGSPALARLLQPDAISCPATGDSWDNGVLDDDPEPTQDHTAVWTGSLMIVWGGHGNFNTVRGSGRRYDPLTDTWTSVTKKGAPNNRLGHSAVWTGTEMIVWGGVALTGPGYNFSPSNTGARYNPVTDSWLPTSMTGAPDPRSGHTAVWTGSRMIVWSGLNVTLSLQSGGLYDPSTDTWTPMSLINAPQSRYGSRAVWTGSRMIVWGGAAGATTPLQTGGRYDPGSDTWTATSTTNASSARQFHTMVWTGSRVIVWGGEDCPQCGSKTTNTGGRYDPVNDTWSPTTVSGAPDARRRHSAVWTGSRMIVWGGENGFGQFPDGARYDPLADAWSPVSAINAPLARFSHSAVWTGAQMILWGGNGQDRAQDSGARYDPVTDTWSPTSRGAGPDFLSVFQGVWTGSQIIFTDNLLNGTVAGGVYDPALDAWTLIPVLQPQPLDGYTQVWIGSELIVWGGRIVPTNNPTNAGWRYQPLTNTWTPMSTVNAPTPRFRHAAIWTGHVLIIWGGQLGDTNAPYTDTGARWDPVTDTWAPMSLLVPASRRAPQIALWTGSRMLIWGGQDSPSHSTNTGSRYDPVADVWYPISTVDAPTLALVGTWTGTRVIVLQGYAIPTLYPKLYDPVSDIWTSTSTANAPNTPADRPYHAVWTGSQLFVCRGDGGSTPSWTYTPGADLWRVNSSVNAPVVGIRPTVWTGKFIMLWSGDSSGSTHATPGQGGLYDPAIDTWTPTSPVDAVTNRSGHLIIPTERFVFVLGGVDTGGATTLRDGGRYILPQDLDSDGVLEACDNCIHASNDAQTNSDGDGFGDACDNCPTVANPSQTNADADALGDACDNCPTTANMAQADTDADGVGNLCDNCSSVANPTQINTDGDNAGDACDCQPSDPTDHPPSEVAGLTVTKSGTLAILAWTLVPDTDAYSVTRGALGSLTATNYGACFAEGLVGPSLQDPAVPAAGGGFAYLVQGQNLDCGLGSAGSTSAEIVRANGNPGACHGVAHTDAHASAQSTVFGTVSGTLANTQISDNTAETITEVLSSGGSPATRFSQVEQRWTITIAPGSRNELHLEAFRTASTDGDDFVFGYSTNGGANFTSLAMASLPLADTNSDVAVALPGGLAGSVIFRVMDTDRTAGHQTLDAVSVDEIFVRSVP